MNRYILILTMSNQEMLDRLLTPLYWESTESAQTIILNQGGKKIKVSRKAMVYHSDENLGCAGGRKFLVQQLMDKGLAPDDQLVFLDDDIEVLERSWLWKLCSPLSREYSISGVDGRKITSDGMSVPCPDAPEYLSGGWCVIRGDVFLDDITWDLDFNPNYFEDAALGKECLAAGKKLFCTGDVGLKHEHPPNEEAAKLVAINREKFLKKWGS